jgi:tRNA G18 (ribose-2'-O)-methylase SpoU
MEIVEIDDPADPRVADFRNLSDADVRPDRRGIVIAEGVNVVERLARSPYPMRAVLGVPARIDALRPALEALDAAAYVVDKWTLSQIVGFRVTRGVLASADRPPPVSSAALLTGSERLAVLEGLNDFENLGALFRNAAALGVDGVLLGAGCSDPLYRRSVRVSMGHVLRVPFATFDVWPGGLDMLRERGFQVAALSPRRDSVSLRSLRGTAAGRVALLLGSEGPGLSEEALAASDVIVRIPMVSGVDSLNVATAAAVAFYEVSGRD